MEYYVDFLTIPNSLKSSLSSTAYNISFSLRFCLYAVRLSGMLLDTLYFIRAISNDINFIYQLLFICHFIPPI